MDILRFLDEEGYCVRTLDIDPTNSVSIPSTEMNDSRELICE